MVSAVVVAEADLVESVRMSADYHWKVETAGHATADPVIASTVAEPEVLPMDY